MIVKRGESKLITIGIARGKRTNDVTIEFFSLLLGFRTQITEFQPTYLHDDVTHVYVNEFVHVRGEPPSHRRVYPAYVNTIDGPKVKSHGRLAHVSCVISYENS